MAHGAVGAVRAPVEPAELGGGGGAALGTAAEDVAPESTGMAGGGGDGMGWGWTMVFHGFSWFFKCFSWFSWVGLIFFFSPMVFQP